MENAAALVPHADGITMPSMQLIDVVAAVINNYNFLSSFFIYGYVWYI